MFSPSPCRASHGAIRAETRELHLAAGNVPTLPIGASAGSAPPRPACRPPASRFGTLPSHKDACAPPHGNCAPHTPYQASTIGPWWPHETMMPTTSKHPSARTRAEMKALRLPGTRLPIVRIGLALVAAVSTVSALASLSHL